LIALLLVVIGAHAQVSGDMFHDDQAQAQEADTGAPHARDDEQPVKGAHEIPPSM